MKEMDISIQPIQPQDNEEIYKIIRKSLKNYQLNKPGTAYYDPYLSQLYEFYQKEKHGEYWILKVNQEITGGIGIGSFGEYPEVAELQKYYIKSEFQGLGLGRLLLEKAITFAQTEDYQSIYIETVDTLEKANQIYKKFGFVPLEKALDGSEHPLMNRWFILEL